MSISARKLGAIALAAIVPVWVYALGVAGGVVVALASTLCVLLIAGGLYLMFGPHEGQEPLGADGI